MAGIATHQVCVPLQTSLPSPAAYPPLAHLPTMCPASLAPLDHPLLPLPLCPLPPQIRESIKSLFPDRDCFTLVRPMNDEDKLARLDSLDPSHMRPEFREGLARLTQLIFNKVRGRAWVFFTDMHLKRSS